MTLWTEDSHLFVAAIFRFPLANCFFIFIFRLFQFRCLGSLIKRGWREWNSPSAFIHYMNMNDTTDIFASTGKIGFANGNNKTKWNAKQNSCLSALASSCRRFVYLWLGLANACKRTIEIWPRNKNLCALPFGEADVRVFCPTFCDLNMIFTELYRFSSNAVLAAIVWKKLL